MDIENKNKELQWTFYDDTQLHTLVDALLNTFLNSYFFF